MPVLRDNWAASASTGSGRQPTGGANLGRQPTGNFHRQSTTSATLQRQGTSVSNSKPRRIHPFVRLATFTANRWSSSRAAKAKKKYEAQQAKEAEEEELKQQAAAQGKKFKKQGKKGFFGRLLGRFGKKGEEEDSDSDDDLQRQVSDEDDFGNVSGADDDEVASEEWDPDQEEEEEEELDAFRPGGTLATKRGWDEEAETIERLGPQDIRELEETMWRMQPNYNKAENMILEEKLERAVTERLNRLRKATKLNAILAFGAPMYKEGLLNDPQRGKMAPHLKPTATISQQQLGNVKVPTLIYVTGHHGAGGNVGINGVYERYPENYHGRPVYQKYLDRHEWIDEPQEVVFAKGQRAICLQDLDDEDGGRTFPTHFDEPATHIGMKHTMVTAKVMPCERAPGAVGDFRYVDKAECWFIFFDDYTGCWCIGPRPGSNAVFARCFGVDEILPDELGPNRWQVFDVGHRTWYTHKNLRTMKGGKVSSALAG